MVMHGYKVGMKNLVRYVTFLTADQLKQLRAISTQTGASVSTLIRMAVIEYLKREGGKS
jgi:ribbon-helix-helix protein